MWPVPTLHIRFNDASLESADPPASGLARPIRLALDASVGGTTTPYRCKLPIFAQDIPILLRLLATTQRGRRYHEYTALPDDPEIVAAYRRADMLTPDARALVDPPEDALGALLFGVIAMQNPVALPIFRDFFGASVSVVDDHHPLRCLVLDFRALCRDSDLCDAILALPWEAMCAGAAREPLLAQGTVIIRQIVDDVADLPPPLVPSVVALRPQHNMGWLRNYEQQALPRAFYGNAPLWCSLYLPQPGLTAADLSAAIAAVQPDVVHYFGHGQLVSAGDGAHDVVLQLDAEREGEADLQRPMALRLDFQRARPRLLALFGCHSGDSAPGGERDAPWASGSLVRALADRVSAILAMQTVIYADAAAIGSEALYQSLAAGQPLLHAVYTLRRKMLRFALEERNRLQGSRHAWWVPACYTRGAPSHAPVCRPEVRPLLAALDERVAPQGVDRTQLLDAARQAAARHAVVELYGERQSGRTVFLRRLAGHFAESGRQYIALSAWPDDGADAAAQLAMLLREVVCHIRKHRQGLVWTQADEEYAAVIADDTALAEPLYVLIDDIDLLEAHLPGAVGRIMPAVRAENVRFIVTRGTEYALSDALRGSTLELVFSPAERAQILGHTFHHYLLMFEAERQQKIFATVEMLVFGMAGELHEDTIILRIAAHDVLAAVPAAACLARLVDAGYLMRAQRHYQLVNPAHREAWWRLPELASRRTLFRHWLAQWRQEHDRPGHTDDHPIELLCTLADPLLLHVPGTPRQILPPPSDLYAQRVSDPYRAWRNLARAYQRHSIGASFQNYTDPLVLVDLQCTELDRAVLHLLAWALQHPPRVQRSDALWGVFIPAENVQEQLLRWQRDEADPLVAVSRVAMRLASGEASAADLARSLEMVSTDERLLSLGWLVLPLAGHLWSPELAAAVEPLLSEGQLRDYLRLLAAISRGSPEHPAMLRAQALFDQLWQNRDQLDAAELRLLWTAVLPGYSVYEHDRRRDVARELLRRWRHSIGPPRATVREQAELVLLRHLSGEAAGASWPMLEGWQAARFVEAALREPDRADALWETHVRTYHEGTLEYPTVLHEACVIYLICCHMLRCGQRSSAVERYAAERPLEVLRSFVAETSAPLSALLVRYDRARHHLRSAMVGLLRPQVKYPNDNLVWLLCGLLESDPPLRHCWYDAYVKAAEDRELVGHLPDGVARDLVADNPYLDMLLSEQLSELLYSAEQQDVLEQSAARMNHRPDWVERWGQQAEQEIRRILNRGLV